MKKIFLKILFINIFILLNQCFLFSQQTSIKFNLSDSSSKTYSIDKLNNLLFENLSDSLVLRIFYQDTLIAYYTSNLIDCILINNSELNLFIKNFPKKYLISEIDSIDFIYDKIQMTTIGKQVWMTQNLNLNLYRNGDTIPNIMDSTDWGNLLTGAWCNFKNNFEMEITYGKLYNWFAVNDARGLAPVGWHVPSDSEWKELEIYLGMSSSDADSSGWRGTNEGGKLKEANSQLWADDNIGATNESGFTALPGGNRYDDGGFGNIDGILGFWWTSTSIGTWNALGRTLTNNTSSIYRGYNMKEYGFSVRCIKNK